MTASEGTAGINLSISYLDMSNESWNFKIFYSMFSSRPMQSLSKMRTTQFTTIQFGPVRSHVSGYFLQRKFFSSFFEEIRFRIWRIRIVFTFFFVFFFCAKGLAQVLRPTSFLAGKDYKRGLCYLCLIRRPVKNPHHL